MLTEEYPRVMPYHLSALPMCPECKVLCLVHTTKTLRRYRVQYRRCPVCSKQLKTTVPLEAKRKKV